MTLPDISSLQEPKTDAALDHEIQLLWRRDPNLACWHRLLIATWMAGCIRE